jgi:quinoprotein dehydrogenase-associated probable ABC transporter substrate-binding protein
MKPAGCISAAVMLCMSALAMAETAAAAGEPVLRVCADPNNLPFSNEKGEGFENRLAQMVGNALHAKVEYTWWAQRRGFVRNTLKAGLCDVVMGVPSDYGLALTTHPYYRSTFVFVYRKDRRYDLHALDDPRLATLKIGLHVLGNDNPPPALILARRGIIDNVIGFSIYGDYRDANPPARLIEAVAGGDVDVAIAWGPLAGYFARQAPAELTVTPIDQPDDASLPMQFSVSLGVRKGDHALKDRLDPVLQKLQPEIDAMLRDYGIPLLNAPPQMAASRP